MAKGLSVHIGLDRVDPTHYRDEWGDPWDGPLEACEADARDMQALAEAQGFTTRLLLTEQATSQNVIEAINQAAEGLESGDILFLSYAGHGGQVPDRNSEFYDELDEMDETWCLYDRELIDDELYALWANFEEGVRIFMLSDSCHSGTMAKDPAVLQMAAGQTGLMRVLPAEVQAATYQAHQALYDQVQADNPSGEEVDIGASVILISGCQDNQVSYDGDDNGLFTGTLLKVWNDGDFRGSITRFWRKIVASMPTYQSPNLLKVGASNPEFVGSRPFTI